MYGPTTFGAVPPSEPALPLPAPYPAKQQHDNPQQTGPTWDEILQYQKSQQSSQAQPVQLPMHNDYAAPAYSAQPQPVQAEALPTLPPPESQPGHFHPHTRQQAIWHQCLRWTSMLLSLIALLTELILAFSAASEYGQYGKTDATATEAETDRNSTSSTSANKSKATKVSSKSSKSATASKVSSLLDDTDALLGTRALGEVVPPLHRLIRRASKSTANTTQNVQYAPNTDIPLRSGAAGFTIMSHIFVAVLFGYLIWMDWCYLRNRPSKFGHWTPTLISCVQLYIAFDLLGRNISKPVQGAAYLLLMFALLSFFYNVYVGFTAHRQNLAAAAQQKASQQEYEQQHQYYLNEPAHQQSSDHVAETMQEKAATGSTEHLDQTEKSPVPANDIDFQASQPGQPRSNPGTKSPYRPRRLTFDDRYLRRTPSLFSGDSESTLYSARHPRRGTYHPYMSRHHSSAFAGDGGDLSSPISLYGPTEQRRNKAQKDRMRAMSNATAASRASMAAGAADAAQNFRDRSQNLPIDEEDEGEEDCITDKDLERHAVDNFATRAKEWKNLHKS